MRSRENPVASVFFFLKQEFEQDTSVCHRRQRVQRKELDRIESPAAEGPVNLTSSLASCRVNPAGGTR